MTLGLRFDHTLYARPRTVPIRGVVLHWTAGIGGPERVYRTLHARKLSIHYTIGVTGEVVPMCSDQLRCGHAGKVNDWTIGIEVVSPGLPGMVRDKEARQGVQRVLYQDKLRGRAIPTLDYTPAQDEAVRLLCEDLCAKHKIKRRVPTEADGSLVRREMTDLELAGFSGVLGHFHCHPSKRDPGSAPLERLRVRWA